MTNEKQRPRRVLRVMVDYSCFPLWEPGSDDYNIDPATLPISRSLVERLHAWAARFDATLDHEYPPDGGFPSRAEEEQFIADGSMLASELQQALGDDWFVEYAPFGGDVTLRDYGKLD